MVILWEGTVICTISADEAKSTPLHTSRRGEHDTIQSRGPKKLYCQAQSKIELEKAKKRSLESMTGDKEAAVNEERDESSEEELTPKQRTPLSSHPTTSLSPSLELKQKYPPTIAASSHPPIFYPLNDMKPTQCPVTLLSPPMSPHTCGRSL